MSYEALKRFILPVQDSFGNRVAVDEGSKSLGVLEVVGEIRKSGVSPLQLKMPLEKALEGGLGLQLLILFGPRKRCKQPLRRFERRANLQRIVGVTFRGAQVEYL